MSYSEIREREIMEAQAAIARGQEHLQGDWQTLKGQDLLDVWYAAVEARYGRDIAERSQAYHAKGRYTTRIACRFPDGSIGTLGGLEFMPSRRKVQLVADIQQYLVVAEKVPQVQEDGVVEAMTRVVPGEVTRMRRSTRPPMCQVCKQREAVYAMQYIGEEEPSFYRLGYHIRGFTMTKVCAECAELLKPKGLELPPEKDSNA